MRAVILLLTLFILAFRVEACDKEETPPDGWAIGIVQEIYPPDLIEDVSTSYNLLVLDSFLILRRSFLRLSSSGLQVVRSQMT